MKKLLSIFVIAAYLFVLCGCQETLKGTDALIEKVREEMPIANEENMEISYAGLVAIEDTALIWFVSGNDYQAHTYLPMECNIVGKDEYTYVRTYKPVNRGNDIVILEWQGGYSFLINNIDCKTIRIIDDNGTHDISIEKETYPFVFHHDMIPHEYYFFDVNGTQL